MDTRKISIQPLSHEVYRKMGVSVSMLRLDKIHPKISGNKWFKLSRNLLLAEDKICHTILSYGGAYSNHLYALAHLCQEKNLHSIGIVRGDELSPEHNETLKACKQAGMQLYFVSRAEYQLKASGNTARQILKDNQVFEIPEGGNNEAGMEGCADILSLVPKSFTHLILPVGTGTTLLGMLAADSEPRTYIGFAAVRKEDPYTRKVAARCEVHYDTEFGGFGRYNNDLLEFIRNFYQRQDIPLDVVYTGKMMYYLHRQILQGNFPKNAKILCLHTGGLQGNPTNLFSSI